ncbi:hypothetical protein C8R44DRAFT_855305 [Mycena epipterygia]|nr:hypothetical protein C8R44DRAFT_855305 [Mycena epipterygia]
MEGYQIDRCDAREIRGSASTQRGLNWRGWRAETGHLRYHAGTRSEWPRCPADNETTPSETSRDGDQTQTTLPADSDTASIRQYPDRPDRARHRVGLCGPSATPHSSPTPRSAAIPDPAPSPRVPMYIYEYALWPPERRPAPWIQTLADRFNVWGSDARAAARILRAKQVSATIEMPCEK